MTRSTREALSGLTVGQRLWFWLLTSPKRTELLLSSLFTDPSMRRLDEDVDEVELLPGARTWRGILHLDALGVPNFGGPGADEELLQGLARWVSTRAGEPLAGRLSGAVVTAVDRQGRVVGRHADDALWETAEVPWDAPRWVPGTPAAAAALLSALKPGEPAAGWITPRASTGGPAVAVARQGDQRGLRSQVRALRGEGMEIPCVIDRLESGGLRLTTEQSLDLTRGGLRVLLAAHPILTRAFLDVQLVCVSGGEARSLRVELGPSLYEVESTLIGLGEGENAYFSWSGDGLRLARDAEALRGSPSSLVSGRLRMGEERALFVARSSHPSLLSELASWVRANHEAWPGLLRLRDARFVVRGEDGTIVSRHRDEAAWASLGREIR